MPNEETLATVASIIAGFGAAMLAFRIEREATAQEEGEPSWLPWADHLLIAAILISLLLVIFPMVSFKTLSGTAERVPAAACSATGVLISGYTLAILAHYRFIFGRKRKGHGENPEPAERLMVGATAIISLALFVGLLLS